MCLYLGMILFFCIMYICISNIIIITLQGTNISPKNGILKMILLFPRWDMLIPWRVYLPEPVAPSSWQAFPISGGSIRWKHRPVVVERRHTQPAKNPAEVVWGCSQGQFGRCKLYPPKKKHGQLRLVWEFLVLLEKWTSDKPLTTERPSILQ